MKTLIIAFTMLFSGLRVANADTIRCVNSETGVTALVIKSKFAIPRADQTGTEMQGVFVRIKLAGKDLGENWILAKWNGFGVQYESQFGRGAAAYFSLTARKDGSFQGYYQSSEEGSLKIVNLNCNYRSRQIRE